jgi:hypothetical protein
LPIVEKSGTGEQEMENTSLKEMNEILNDHAYSRSIVEVETPYPGETGPHARIIGRLVKGDNIEGWYVDDYSPHAEYPDDTNSINFKTEDVKRWAKLGHKGSRLKLTIEMSRFEDRDKAVYDGWDSTQPELWDE